MHHNETKRSQFEMAEGTAPRRNSHGDAAARMALDSPELSIIFPAFNEAENLKRFPSEVLPILDSLGRSYEIVIVDDGSSDATSDVAATLGQKVRLVRHPKNRGLGAALRTGFEHARGALVVTADTDLTFSPSLIRGLLARFDRGDVDVVSGSPKLAGYASEIPSYRIFVSHMATLVYSTILGARITAVSPILRLYRRSDLQAIDLRATGFDVNAELLFGLMRSGCRVAEVPAPLTQRIHGTSSLNYAREMRRHAKLVSRMLAWRLGTIAARRADAERTRGGALVTDEPS